MTAPYISTPRGFVTTNRQGKAELVWSTNFQPKWQGRYTAAQRFVDESVLKGCTPLVPFRTGVLVNTGILGTTIGSGEVSWIAPYARAQYYMANRRSASNGESQRGSFWFARFKELHGRQLIAKARKIAGQGQ
jgi:hypothetical protein